MGEAAVLTTLLFAAAVLYASVGHAGASAYLAAMALFGVAPEVMRPAALVLNTVVATIGTVRFYRAGCFVGRIFWPFAVAAIPAAAVGGYLQLPGTVYKPLVGLVLLAAAVRMLRAPAAVPDEPVRPVSEPLAAVCGGGIGLLAGLTGTGGGIFLSPLLVLMRWATVRQSAGVAAAFILANSLAGLVGLLGRGQPLPEELQSRLPVWIAAVLLGGLVGSELGARRLGTPMLRRLLGVVLLVAAAKMFLELQEWRQWLVME